MKKRMSLQKLAVCAAVLLLPVAAVPGYTGEINLLVDTLAEKGVITYGEAQSIMTETSEAMRNDLAKGAVPTLPAWIQNMSVKGDLRLRQQHDWSSSVSNARSRQRIRLRLGFDTRVVENLKAGFGLATGSEGTSGTSIIDAEPSSTNHTLSNGFAKAVVMVDYAFLEYTPFAWMKVTGGKMKAGAPFWHTTDLQWDSDINQDGLAINLSKNFGTTSVFFNSAWLIFNELNSATVTNPDAYIAQPGASLTFAERYTVKAAVAFEKLNVSGKNTGYYGTPAFDYVCTSPSAEFSANDLMGPYSASIFADMIQNGDAKPTADKAGSAYGFKFGHAKVAERGTWQVVYMQRRIESNAWLSKLGDSDAYGGLTNAAGYEAILTCGLTRNASLSIDYYHFDKITGTSATTPKSLLQCDLVYKF